MSGRPTSIGATLAGGIQDVSALLPIIGTEQCEIHVGSALKGGYLYAAATPLSIFGSLGIVKAGISVLITSISVSIPKMSVAFHNFKPTIDYSEQRKWLGAKFYSNAGFRLSGTVAPLIGMDGQRFKAETRLLEILDEKHIDNPEKLSVDWRSRQWNIMLVITTFLCAALSLMPYIALLIGPQSWRPGGIHLPILYPILRVVGSCFATISCQIIIQSRVISLMKSRILFMIIDRRLKTTDQEGLDGWMKDNNLQWDQNLPAEQCLSSLEDVLSLAPVMRPVESSNKPEDRTAIHEESASPPAKNENDLAKDVSHVSISMTSKTSSPPIPQAPSPEIPSFQENDLYILQQKHFPSHLRDTTFILLSWITLGISLPATVAGYIGGFTLVSATPTRGNGPLVWVGLEVALSILRVIIWASNPSFDEETEITLGLELSEHPPMVTTDKFDEYIDSPGAEDSEPFQLVPELEFLEWITPFTGPLDQFLKTDNLTLYFTLTTDHGASNIVLSQEPNAYEADSDSDEDYNYYYYVLANDWGFDDVLVAESAERFNPSRPHRFRLLMTVFDSNMQTGVTMISSKKSIFYSDVTLKYNTISRQMEADRESPLRDVHTWRSQDDKLFDSLKQYYQIIVGSINQRDTRTTPRAILPWNWDLTSNLGPANGQAQPKDVNPDIQLPLLTDQDVLYLDRGCEHQLKIDLVCTWGQWIVQDMENLRSDSRNDCHKALKNSTSDKGKCELTELDAQLAWGWARRELVLLKLSLELEGILRLKLKSCVSAVNCVRRNTQLMIRMSSEFELGRRKRLEHERGEAKRRMEEAMKNASGQADREDRPWQDALSFRPRWTHVIDFIDSQWRAGIEDSWAEWKDTEAKLEAMIGKTHERQNEYTDSRSRFLEEFRMRVSHRHWCHQREVEEQLMKSTIERIRVVPADGSRKKLESAYQYPPPDRQAVVKFPVLKKSSSKGRACSAMIYDAHGCEKKAVCHVIAKSTTRSIVNVSPEILPSIPPNDHLLFLSCSEGDGQEPDFIQRNRDRWWDQQTANSSMFYFTAPMGDSTSDRMMGRIIAHVLVFLTTPSAVQVCVVHSSCQNLLIQENRKELGKIYSSSQEFQSMTLQNFLPFVLQPGKHTLELAQENSYDTASCWDILIELSTDDTIEAGSTFSRAASDDNLSIIIKESLFI